MWIFWLLSFHQREIHVSLHSLPRVPTSFVTKVGHGFSHWVSSHCKHWFHMKCISSNANAPHIRLFYQWHAQCAMLGDIFKLAMGRPWEMPCHPWSHCQRCCCAPLDRECPRSCLPCNICSLQLAQLHAQQSPAARCLHFAALTLLLVWHWHWQIWLTLTLTLTLTITLTNLVGCHWQWQHTLQGMSVVFEVTKLAWPGARCGHCARTFPAQAPLQSATSMDTAPNCHPRGNHSAFCTDSVALWQIATSLTLSSLTVGIQLAALIRVYSNWCPLRHEVPSLGRQLFHSSHCPTWVFDMARAGWHGRYRLSGLPAHPSWTGWLAFSAPCLKSIGVHLYILRQCCHRKLCLGLPGDAQDWLISSSSSGEGSPGSTHRGLGVEFAAGSWKQLAKAFFDRGRVKAFDTWYPWWALTMSICHCHWQWHSHWQLQWPWRELAPQRKARGTAQPQSNFEGTSTHAVE